MIHTSRLLTCAGLETHFTEWGDAQAPPVLCVHGLARTGRDFDELAQVLARRYRVICPDVPGRGLSQWARDRERDYNFENYGAVLVALCDGLGLHALRWVGTSMGGLIGMRLAAGALQGRITHLVLNDIGPELPADATTRIAEYVGNPPHFATLAEVEAWLREVYAPFGKSSDAYWRRMALTSARRCDDGRLTVHYDPRIASQFTAHEADFDLWDDYDALRCPVLLLRGANSDVLPRAVAEQMTRRGPRAELVEFAGCGHAPTLVSDAQQAPVLAFLAR